MSFLRPRLSGRPHRVIYNDDGDTRQIKGGREAFLAERFNRVLNTDVDTYFWCIQMHDDAVGGNESWDANEVMLDAARQNNLEIWATARMNDTHDAHWPAEVFNATEPDPVEVDWKAHGWDAMSDEQKKSISLLRPIRLKQTHPQMLVGPQPLRGNVQAAPFGSILHMNWSALDYAYRQVRQYYFDRIEAICRNHDWDGLELDFIRMPVFFKPGEIEKNIPTMTGFIGEVRALLDKIGQERGRPFPLAVHVPGAPKYCLRCGLDINYWLANDFVDLVVMSTAYTPHGQIHDPFANLCRYHGVPAVTSLNVGPTAPDSTIDGKYSLERFRGRVSALWLEDIDGIQIFNLFSSALVGAEGGPLDELNLVGDPQKLIGKDKLYEAATTGTWVDREILADPIVTPCLVDEQPLMVKVGDPVERLAKSGTLKELRLEVRVTEITEEQSVQISLNGYPVEITDRRKEPRETPLSHGGHPVRTGGWWFSAVVDAPPARRGTNYVLVRPGPGCVGSHQSRVVDARIWVRN